MKFKRIICLLISVLICISASPAGSVRADESNNFDLSAYGEQMRVLSDLGIISSDAVQSSDISRGEFADITVRMLGMQPTGGSGNAHSMFNDVSTDYKYGSSIELAVKAGIMSGDGNGCFRPEKNVSAPEAMKVLVCLLGYGMRAEANGGYPAGYIREAVSLKISGSTGADSTAPLARQSLYKMLYNTLLTEIARQDSYGSDKSYSVSNDRLFTEEYLNVYVSDGIITASDSVCTDGGELCRSGRIRMDGETYKLARQIPDRVGYKIKLFYEKHGSERTVVSYLEQENKVITLSAENIEKFDKQKTAYEYMLNSKNVRFMISSGSAVVYNGEVLKSNMEKYAVPKHGSVTLIDNNGDSVYDVVFIEDYINIVVDRYSSYKNSISERLDIYASESHVINLDDYDRVVILDESNEEKAADKLKKNDILSVFSSIDSKSLTIKVSSKKIIGRIDEFNSADKKIITGGTQYSLSDDLKFNVSSVKAGDNYSFYMDCMGEIAFMEKSSWNSNLAYLISVSENKKGLETEGYIKLMNSEADVNVYSLADKVRVTYYENGVKTKLMEPEEIVSKVNGERYMVLFDFKAKDESNASGKYDTVTELTLPLIAETREMAAQASDYPIINNKYYLNDWPNLNDGETKTVTFKRGMYGIANHVLFDKTGTYFAVPPLSVPDVDDVNVGTAGIWSIPTDTSMAVSRPSAGGINEFEAYSYGGDRLQNNIMVWYSSNVETNVKQDSRAYMVLDVTSTWNAEKKEEETKLTLGGDVGQIAEFTVENTDMLKSDYLKKQKHVGLVPAIDESKTEIESGDIIKIKASSVKKVISDIVLIYDRRNNKMCYDLSQRDTLSRIAVGTVLRVGNVAGFEFEVFGGNIERNNFDSDKPIIYDEKSKTGKVGTVSDVEVGDTIVVDERWDICCQYFIYK